MSKYNEKMNLFCELQYVDGRDLLQLSSNSVDLQETKRQYITKEFDSDCPIYLEIIEDGDELGFPMTVEQAEELVGALQFMVDYLKQ